MGFLIGAGVSALGSIIGGNQSAKKENEAASTAMTGYNYLKNSQILQNAQSNGVDAQNSAYKLLTSPNQNNPAFQNYLNSTGYQFQLGQGTSAITGNAAAKGLLDSGATAKALQGYGQGLAGNYFNSYLNDLNGVAGQGIQAAEATGQAGTTAGNNAGNYQAQAGQSIGTSTSQAFNTFGGGIGNFLGSGH